MKKYYPQIIRFKNQTEYASFLKKNEVIVIELFDTLAGELFISTHPKIYFSGKDVQKKATDAYLFSLHNNNFYSLGSWVYHPWNKTLLHLIPQLDYLNLRTIRHKYLLSETDQKSLYNKKIAIAGLSVGSNILLSLIRHGIGRQYKIADMDKVNLSNINRTVYSLHDIGLYKTEVMLQMINGIDPFIKVETYQEGLNSSSLLSFIDKTDLIIDAFDQFDLKINLRKLAKKKKIPIISGFDIEKGILLIVERYDIESAIKSNIFINETGKKLLRNDLTINEKTKLFIDIIGKKHHSRIMLKSVREVGKTLTGYPQLIIATLLAASAFTLASEKVLLNKSITSYRKFISLDQLVQ